MSYSREAVETKEMYRVKHDRADTAERSCAKCLETIEDIRNHIFANIGWYRNLGKYLNSMIS